MATAVPTSPRQAQPLTGILLAVLLLWLGAAAALWFSDDFSGGRLIGLVFFVLSVPSLVMIHELGHYTAARLVGWRVPLFVWGSLTIRLSPFRVSVGARPFPEAAGAIVAVPPQGRENKRDWIFILAAGPAASLLAGILFAAASVAAAGRTGAGVWYTLIAVIALLDGVLNLLPRRRGSDGRQILGFLRGTDVWRSALCARVFEQIINGVRPRDWPQPLIKDLRLDGLWSGNNLVALRLYAYHLDRGEIEAARAALGVTSVHPEIQTEKAFLAAYLDGDAPAARDLLLAQPMQHRTCYWRAAAAIAVAERDVDAGREAIRKGRHLCATSAYATAFDSECFDELARRLDESD